MGEMRLADGVVYNARPTLRLDGQESVRLNALLRRMDMREQEGGLAALELCFANWESSESGGAGYAFEDEALLKLGARISVHAGAVSAPQEIFRGRISALELALCGDGAPELVVLAEDALQGARLQRRIQVHEHLKIADLVPSVAASLSLTPHVTGFTDDIGTWVQFNESDLAFLRRLLRRYDGDLQVVGADLQVSPRAEVRRNAIELQFGGQLQRVRVSADLAHQVTAVSVSGWNARDGAAVQARATSAELGPGSGRSAAQLLADTFGEREEHIGHLAVATDAEARAIAAAAFAERARGFVRVDGRAQGNPALRVGSELTLAHVSPRFDNRYYVTRCCHRYDLADGYVTDFGAESAYLGNP